MTDMNQNYAIGIDLGTGSCKTVLLDQSGKILGRGTASYLFSSTESQWQEQDPESLVDGSSNLSEILWVHPD